MKVVIAPDSFKGSLTASQAAAAMARGVRRAAPDAEVVTVPMADGGEGTVQALVDATGGSLRPVTVTGPLGEPVAAGFGLAPDGATAFIEMAAASGLPLVPPERRNPLLTTSYGTGELIGAALVAGCRRLVIGIGGSATNDGGAGALQALGLRMLDSTGAGVGPGGAAPAPGGRGGGRPGPWEGCPPRAGGGGRAAPPWPGRCAWTPPGWTGGWRPVA